MKIKTFPITQIGQPVLRQKAKAVTPAEWPTLLKFLPIFHATMVKAQGVGIAAPQVGVPWRAFIVAPEPSVRYPKAKKIPAIVMINPVLLSHSKETVTDWEGCLSVPGLRGKVPRWKSLDAEFLDVEGIRRRIRLSGFIARIFQHEFDHINGFVYIDRVADTRTFMMESEYRKLQ